MSVIEEVAAERRRQQEVEGWTPEHDDDHDEGAMAKAGAVYALWDTDVATRAFVSEAWPWEQEWLKPKDQRRNLIRAAALIVAEIERLDRAPDADAKRFGWTDTTPDAR